MNRQIKGIGLLLFGIQLVIFAVIDPWLPVLGNLGQVALPLLSLICGGAGLILCLKGRAD